jgi:hypothetical protein
LLGDGPLRIRKHRLLIELRSGTNAQKGRAARVRLIRSVGRASVLAGVLVFVLAASALAHDCYNASASAQGALSKAEHSQTWVLAADVREIIVTGGSGFFPVGSFPVLDTCQQQAFLAEWATSGLPLVFTTAGKQAVGQEGVIAENNPNMDTKLGGNNKGIDHFEVTSAQLFGAIADSYNAAFSACP